MASNHGFNTTTLTFASAVTTPIRSVGFSNSVAEIDVTGSTDAVHVFEVGLSDPTITCELIGASSAGALESGATSLTAGTTGALLVTYNTTGGTLVPFNAAALLTSVERGGSLDGELTTSLTFRPI